MCLVLATDSPIYQIDEAALAEPYLEGFEWVPIKDDWEAKAEQAAMASLIKVPTSERGEKAVKTEKEPTEEERAHAIENEKSRWWGTLKVHTSAQSGVSNVGGGKKKGKKGTEEALL